MAKADENPTAAATPNSKASMPSPNPPGHNNKNNKNHSPISVNSQTSSSHPKNDVILVTPPINPEEYIFSVAAKIASQPLQCSDPDVWGVLTAISDKARKRHQGMNMLLTSDVHCIGRLVEDVRFQIVAPAVSASHCRIYRKVVTNGDADNPSRVCTAAFLKDCSTNGTYLNSKKLNKTSSEAKLCHGDVISIALAPHNDGAYAFVFREASNFNSTVGAVGLKRKADDADFETKRLKGIGIGASEGPISLDDFRSLQRSNTELRKQLEEHVVKIDSLRSEYHSAIQNHENELKVQKESVSQSYLGQLKEMEQSIKAKEEELMDLKRTSSEQKHAMDDLNEIIGAHKQSYAEANEVINSQKASISELEALLEEEREQRREEREKATIDLKSSIQKVQAEAQEEMKRLSDASTRREKEQQEVIDKLQNSEKERSLLVETLRSKLEETRQKLVTSENKVRQLEAQIFEEQTASASRQKRVDELELQTKQMRKELQREKAAREEAWAKVSALELEISATMRDLDFERRRLKAAKERIMLRETQLRAFYSTTEEIQILCAKQQEQLKAMQRTLEDEDDHENASVGCLAAKEALQREKEVRKLFHSPGKSVSCTSSKRRGRDQDNNSGDEGSSTEKHDCNLRIEGEDTQEVDFTGAERVSKGGFGSDIDAVATAPVGEVDHVDTEKYPEVGGTDTAPAVEGDLVQTERVLETQSAGVNGEGDIDLNKCGSFVEDTMQIDDEVHGGTEQAQPVSCGSLHNSESTNPLEVQDRVEDTQGGGSIRTSDLLASELPGSWACSTAPSDHGENDSPKSKENEEVAEHPSSSKLVTIRSSHEHQALSEMIGIIAPDLKDQFSCAAGTDSKQEGSKDIDSGSDTEGCSDNSRVNSEDEHGEADEAVREDDADSDKRMDEDDDEEDDEATQCDSP